MLGSPFRVSPHTRIFINLWATHIYDSFIKRKTSLTRGGDSHMKQTGMLVVSLRGVNLTKKLPATTLEIFVVVSLTLLTQLWFLNRVSRLVCPEWKLKLSDKVLYCSRIEWTITSHAINIERQVRTNIKKAAVQSNWNSLVYSQPCNEFCSLNCARKQKGT